MRAALYARYSTDLQREQSIDDQFRVAERLAEQNGFTVTAKFFDRAISGGTTQRPGYQYLLRCARNHEFDAVVAEDTSRLWRNLAEQSPRLAELSDLGIVIVTHDLDTRHDSAEIMGAVGGAMASAYRKEIGRRTRRGLEGLARNGKSAGGRAYGYIPAAQSGTQNIEIDPAQAAVVVRIFSLYADGHSPRGIADLLNREGVPSPGAGWERSQRRKSGWMGSAINGDHARGIGILNNDTYRGIVVWNRSRWIRSAADSSKRKYTQNPRTEWIVRKDERLRIVPDVLWDRAKARQSGQAGLIGMRVKRGLSAAMASRTGAGPKYLLSSLLRCGHCGSNYVIAGRDIYGCSGNINGGLALCANDAKIHRQTAEMEVVSGFKRDIRSPAVKEEACRDARSLLRKPTSKPSDNHERIAQLRAEVGNIADAIASGMMRASKALASRLRAAESELEREEQAQALSDAPTPSAERLLPALPAIFDRLVDNLDATLASGDLTRGREEIRSLVGCVTVRADADQISLFYERGNFAATMIKATGTHAILCGSGGRI
jgi:site-specific DNA recombinase